MPVPREKGKEKEKEKVVLLVDAGAGARAPKLRSKVLGKPVLDAAELSLVRKTPMQRARRSCHRCETLFVGRAVRCENCAHERCAACPRSP